MKSMYKGVPFEDRESQGLPAEITRRSSKQTYYTFRLLVDRQRVQDAYSSYAYYRWVDDRLDCELGNQQENIDFIKRQRQLLDASYRRELMSVVCPEEQMLVDLISHDYGEASGLQSYLRNMMDVMVFDVQRKGRLISLPELTRYSQMLSTAVTDLLFYFLCRDDHYAHSKERYQAVRGAHIIHMLRDMLEDIDCGYINISADVLQAQRVSLAELNSPAFRHWVKDRVELARQCFATGRKYFSTVKDLHCRLAAYAYLARFEWMAGAIEHDDYRLRHAYPERKSVRAGSWMAWRVIRSMVNKYSWVESNKQIALPD